MWFRIPSQVVHRENLHLYHHHHQIWQLQEPHKHLLCHYKNKIIIFKHLFEKAYNLKVLFHSGLIVPLQLLVCTLLFSTCRTTNGFLLPMNSGQRPVAWTTFTWRCPISSMLENVLESAWYYAKLEYLRLL